MFSKQGKKQSCTLSRVEVTAFNRLGRDVDSFLNQHERMFLLNFQQSRLFTFNVCLHFAPLSAHLVAGTKSSVVCCYA